MLSIAREFGDLSEGLESDLLTALAKRNYLAHRFFVEHDLDLLREPGRRAIIDELRGLIDFFGRVDKAAEEFRRTLTERFGLTEELVTSEIERITRLYETHDGAV